MKQTSTRSQRRRITVLMLGFAILGGLSACSQVKREVVSSKQASAVDRSKVYGHGASGSAQDRSLWNLNHRDIN